MTDEEFFNRAFNEMASELTDKMLECHAASKSHDIQLAAASIAIGRLLAHIENTEGELAFQVNEGMAKNAIEFGYKQESKIVMPKPDNVLQFKKRGS